MASSNSSLWADATHLTASGKVVFQQQEAAIRSLAKIVNPDPVVIEVILATLALDRTVVETAIAECTDAARKATAQSRLEAAIAATAAGNFVVAVREMGLAWKATQK